MEGREEKPEKNLGTYHISQIELFETRENLLYEPLSHLICERYHQRSQNGQAGTKVRFRRRTFHEPNLIRIKADSNYLDRLD